MCLIGEVVYASDITKNESPEGSAVVYDNLELFSEILITMMSADVTTVSLAMVIIFAVIDPPSGVGCVAVGRGSVRLVVEVQRGELVDQLVQSALLLVDDEQVVCQRGEQTLAPRHQHVPANMPCDQQQAKR